MTYTREPVDPVRRYAIALPGVPGAHARARTVVVHLTDELSPEREPIYQDTTGLFRFRISGTVAEVLSAPAEYGTVHPCLEAVPMP
ncbi:DUF6296 family protein [Kitasatospora sp. NPDC056076]|uniref:DUF6296 family protein n=1 Tax=Kitasatospora sp. NPDC056076 TaxID=3345703 RepID=UPI0035D82B2E